MQSNVQLYSYFNEVNLYFLLDHSTNILIITMSYSRQSFAESSSPSASSLDRFTSVPFSRKRPYQHFLDDDHSSITEPTATRVSFSPPIRKETEKHLSDKKAHRKTLPTVLGNNGHQHDSVKRVLVSATDFKTPKKSKDQRYVS